MTDKTKRILLLILMMGIIFLVCFLGSWMGQMSFHSLNPGVNSSNFDPWKAYNCSLNDFVEPRLTYTQLVNLTKNLSLAYRELSMDYVECCQNGTMYEDEK